MRSAEQIKSEIEALQSELDKVAPAELLSVREIARRAGISVTTAHRFKQGKDLDVTTVKSLMHVGLIKQCPICGTRP